MPLHPATQQLIRKVEQLSGRLVYVTEDPKLKVMATVSPARGSAPAHFLRYRPGTRAVDYLVAYQLGFLVRLFSCPVEERWEVFGNPAEEQSGIEAMEITFEIAMLGTRGLQVNDPAEQYTLNSIPGKIFRATVVMPRVCGISVNRSVHRYRIRSICRVRGGARDVRGWEIRSRDIPVA